MSERLPYETFLSEQLNNLPLPGENMAWDDMRRRLDEDDSPTPVAWWRRGCLPLGLLLVVMVAISFWLSLPDKWFDKKQEPESAVATTGSKKKGNAVILDSENNFSPETARSRQEKNNPDEQNKKAGAPDSSADNFKTKRTASIKPAGQKTKTTARTLTQNGQNKTEKANSIVGKNNTIQKGNTKNRNPANGILNANIKVAEPGLTGSQQDIAENADTVGKEFSPTKIATAGKQKNEGEIPFAETVDSSQKKNTFTLAKDSNYNKLNSKDKKDSVQKEKMTYGAGIGLQQQLPVAGQQWNPYNAQGRKGTLADYIPSIYFRATKPGKWFVQSEFRYGAPQFTKEFIYKQIVIRDSILNPRYTTTFSSTLKKTYYHQVPVTFNYSLYKNWSVGAGIQWNSFKSAIAEQEQSRFDNLTQQDSVLSKRLITVNKDSANNFRKYYLLGIIESQYKWKRFSAGARYNFGLQPYIEFTLPGGMPQQEKNASLQLFLRYELWKSKKK